MAITQKKFLNIKKRLKEERMAAEDLQREIKLVEKEIDRQLEKGKDSFQWQIIISQKAKEAIIKIYKDAGWNEIIFREYKNCECETDPPFGKCSCVPKVTAISLS